MILIHHPAFRGDDRGSRLGNKRAFSLLEVVMAALIFTTSTVGIFATVQVISNRLVADNVALMKILYAQYVLDSMRQNVTSVTWSSGASLSVETGKSLPATSFYPGYAGTYDIVSDSSGARKIVISVTTPP